MDKFSFAKKWIQNANNNQFKCFEYHIINCPYRQKWASIILWYWSLYEMIHCFSRFDQMDQLVDVSHFADFWSMSQNLLFGQLMMWCHWCVRLETFALIFIDILCPFLGKCKLTCALLTCVSSSVLTTHKHFAITTKLNHFLADEVFFGNYE